MSSRSVKSQRTIGERVVELELQLERLKSILNAAFRIDGYVLKKTGSGLYIHNTSTLVDTLIAPP